MSTTEKLDKIRPVWIKRVSYQLAQGESVRQNFVDQLDQFFDLLIQAVLTGDPSWMNDILDRWAYARTVTEIESQEVSLAPILSRVMTITHQIASEILDDHDAVELLGAVIPIYTYAVQYTTRLETKVHIEHITSELDDARINLEKLDKCKSDFISVAAHELKTPLTLIDGYTSIFTSFEFSDFKAI